MQLEVIRSLGLCLLQDAGRFGWQHMGVSPSGVMDEISYRWANWLLGNPSQASVIEITLGQTEFVVKNAGWIGITGADLNAKVNGLSIDIWQAIYLDAGDILHFANPVKGLRTYISCADGWSAKPKLGSVATNTRESIGGLTGLGEPLKSGDKIESSTNSVGSIKTIPNWLVPDFGRELEFGVIPGFQFDQFAFAEREKLFNSEYQLTKDCDRMGYRLCGNPILTANRALISEPVVQGAIQVPADGQPIVLMADRQTLGGYPKIGTVFSLDRAMLSQRLPGQSIRFRKMSHYEARNRRLVFESRLA